MGISFDICCMIERHRKGPLQAGIKHKITDYDGPHQKQADIGTHLYKYIPIDKNGGKEMAWWGVTSESQARAQAKYDAGHTTRISLKLNNKTDQDIIRWLGGQKSMQGAIKRLIRKEIAKTGSKDQKAEDST